MSALDAETFLRGVCEVPRVGASSDLFKSEVFGIWTQPPIPVEVMGGFSVRNGAGWREVAPTSREAVSLAGTAVFVPSAEELVTILLSFGRPKDRERAAMMP
jgi:hypothetical protein